VIAPRERWQQQGEYKIRPYGPRDFLHQSAVDWRPLLEEGRKASAQTID